LSDGDHAITAVATDAAGNSGTATPNLHVTIDATPPAAPGNLDLADSSDTGDSTSDNVTSDYTPTLTGTAEADSTVTLYDSDGTTVLGTATATGGVWSITSSTLGSGGHNLTAVATDAAGNASDPSAALSVTIEAPLTLSGGTRGDLLVGSAGDDTLDGGKGADTMVGGDGNDTFFVDNRGDTIVEAPGEGVDQVYAARSIVLAANVENVTLEGNGNSNATGNDLDNAIVGNAHNNVLTGGLGADTLTGGEGRDRFVYGSVADSPVGHPDVITDFNSAQRDRIDLRAIDANPLKSGNQAFTFIGSAAFSSTDATGQLRFDPATHMLYGSTNADGAPEFAIELAGVTTLSARDFSL
jgi:Ca2+-binding RTX toxin-like protein